MAGLEDRLRRLEERQGQGDARSSQAPESPARARMRASLEEFAAAKREGRAPSAEAQAVAAAILGRRRRRDES